MNKTAIKTSPTHNVFGMNLPVIADLGDGYKLVAHKNGPGIASDTALYALDCAVVEPPAADVLESMRDCDDEPPSDIPHHVRRDAVRKYREWTWPLVRDQFEFKDD